jgi:hypothetical protein
MRIQQIFFLTILLSGYNVLAQTGSNNPYSMYGIGDIRPLGFGRQAAMGGAGIAMPSDITLNNANPASYYAIDSLTFRVETGFDSKYSQLTSGSQHQSNTNVNLSCLVIGFRNTSWWANSIGLLPYSSSGYDINTISSISYTPETYKTNFHGSGGLNQIYWGNSFTILPKLTVGVNLAFLFGSIDKTQTLTSNYFGGNLVTADHMYLNKLYANYGAQYRFKLSAKIKGTVGGILGTPCKLNLNHEVTTTDNNGTILDDKIDKQKSFTLPAYRGLGLGVEFSDKLILTGEYKYSNWAKSAPIESGLKFANSDDYRFGAEYTPSTSFRDAYLKKLKYRIGGFYSNSYVKIKGEQLVDKGLTLGVGVPMMQRRMYINFAYQLGKKGVEGNYNGIINEKYQGVFINISLIDFWFVKPKFD